MVKGKEKKDLQSYRLGNGAIDMVALRNDFAAGFTIILNGLERYVGAVAALARGLEVERSEEHTSELQSLMRSSYAVFCLKKKKINPTIKPLYRHHTIAHHTETQQLIITNTA